jgi:sugar phosphate isomerase/epimerase
VLTHVHVAEKLERAAPGCNGDDFRPLFSVLHEIGYDQRISIECHWQNLVGEVGLAIATLRKQWEEAA